MPFSRVAMHFEASMLPQRSFTNTVERGRRRPAP